MSDKLTIITNNVPRDVLDAHELTPDERGEFDYLDWTAIEEGRGSATFVRYKGEAYDLADFEVWTNPSSPLREGWDAMRSDTFFSGLLVRYVDEDSVIIGRYYS